MREIWTRVWVDGRCAEVVDGLVRSRGRYINIERRREKDGKKDPNLPGQSGESLKGQPLTPISGDSHFSQPTSYPLV